MSVGQTRSSESVPAVFIVTYLAILAVVMAVLGLTIRPVLDLIGLDGRLEPVSLERLALACRRLVAWGGGMVVATLLAARWALGRSFGSRRAGLAMAMATLAILCLSLEILLRVVPAYSAQQVYDRSPLYAPSRFAFHHLLAEDHDILDTVDLGANAPITATLRNGYRGERFVPDKPEGEIRVVILGGSHVYDSNALRGRSWPALAEKQLHAAGFDGVRIINAGIPGHTSLDAIGRLVSEIHLLRPDAIMVCHAYNDLRYFRWAGPERTPMRYLPTLVRLSPRKPSRIVRWLERSQILLRLGLLIPEDRRGIAEARVADQGLPDVPSPDAIVQFELNLRTLVAVSHRIGAVPVLLTQARAITPANVDHVRASRLANHTTFSYAAAAEAFGRTDAAIRRIAEEEGARFLDLATPHSGKPEYFRDLVHLTPEGSEALAVTLADFLADLLRSGALPMRDPGSEAGAAAP